MKLGIMQPYFLPYIGYFSLIANTDRFILLDTVQFIRHGWIERNRILKPDKGWQYIRVPLIKPNGREALIKDVLINNKEKWQERILAQLQHYKKTAPYYRVVIDLLGNIFSDKYDDIVACDKFALEKVLEYLGINKTIEVFSEINLQIEKACAPDEWALNICKAIKGVDEYWNPPGGMSFFDGEKYKQNNIALKFQSVKITEYDQKRELFEPALSIIDVLMFNSAEETREMLGKYELA